MTIQEAIDKLLDAYNEGVLFHGDCEMCAVGNLLGCREWEMFFVTLGSRQFYDEQGCFLSRSALRKAKNAFDESGFTIKELARIEFAFEYSIHNTKEGYDFWIEGKNEKQGQFIGLCAVLDVLQEIEKEREEKAVDFELEKEKLESIYQEKCNA